ncbi:hypothetical protein ASE63_13450 [Bosea sp. Root381]|uniref:hypothetical protein n=1 Tax=Bosea sp. Root381 TaxID=1736524 RepID=UPI0006FEF891|nr:hypothetical protein [Bosea sp. Root381]KRE17451.1 hypothetical protein ASE63_13450 [Bosea sp. Root381]
MPVPAFVRITIAAASLTLAACSEAGTQNIQSDLTIFVGGDMLAKGGVVFIHPLPVSEERWREIREAENRTLQPPEGLAPIADDGKRLTTTITGQAVHVQFLYPRGERRYMFRFRPVPEAGDAAAVGTRLLTVGGIDSATGLGPAMAFGFVGLHDVGDQTIQVARGDTDHFIARALVGAVGGYGQPLEKPSCEMGSAVAVCGYDEAQWARIAQRWEEEHRKGEWERRRFKALDACYRGAERQGRTGGHCHLQGSDGEEPIVYEYRDKAG